MRMRYENTFYTETEVSGDTISTINANINVDIVAGFRLHTNIVNYEYFSQNGVQLNAFAARVQRTLTTGNNFSLQAFGQGTNSTAFYFGTDTTTLSTIADNGLVRAQILQADT
jgi:hypothetical protein